MKYSRNSDIKDVDKRYKVALLSSSIQKGTMDLLPCVQVPITISLPHFYRADPSLLANVASGLKPNKKDHEFYISLEMVIVCFDISSKILIYFNKILSLEFRRSIERGWTSAS